MKLLNHYFNHLYKDTKKVYKIKLKGSNFEFDGINVLYYGFNKTSIYRGGTYIDSPKWLKDKR